jgi:hypothetical protein
MSLCGNSGYANALQYTYVPTYMGCFVSFVEVVGVATVTRCLGGGSGGGGGGGGGVEVF